MRLVRRLDRELSDGASIVVERGWLTRFARGESGFVVTGEQVSVSVDAPPSLARLAALEEQRDTSTMFPIRLTPTGDILAVGAAESDSAVAEAVRVAQAMLARAGADDASHRRHLAAIQAASMPLLDSMPRDLFFPKAAAWTDRRSLELPGGGSGTIAVRYEARTSKGAPWLGRAERVVTTSVKDNHRTSREIWTLVRA